ncbi:MAG TPA: hypothetical protein VI794_02295 [Patescibacteria group bacterium]|nr:hypothetical protein [Patescibacteria group bacterium]
MRIISYLVAVSLLALNLWGVVTTLQPAYAADDDGGGITKQSSKVDCVDIGFICLKTDPAGFANDILGIGIGIGTLLATVFLVIGGFGVATSGGNPESLENAKTTITSAIAGLLFILMSVLILSIIGGGVIGIDFFK